MSNSKLVDTEPGGENTQYVYLLTSALGLTNNLTCNEDMNLRILSLIHQRNKLVS